PVALVLSRAGEIHQSLVRRGIANSGQLSPAAQQKGVADDLGLLLDAIARQRPAGLEAVVVAAQRMAVEQQVPFAAPLGLPDVSHLMDEQAGPRGRNSGEVVTISLAKRMKMQVSARRHRGATWLQW